MALHERREAAAARAMTRAMATVMARL